MDHAPCRGDTRGSYALFALLQAEVVKLNSEILLILDSKGREVLGFRKIQAPMMAITNLRGRICLIATTESLLRLDLITGKISGIEFPQTPDGFFPLSKNQVQSLLSVSVDW